MMPQTSSLPARTTNFQIDDLCRPLLTVLDVATNFQMLAAAIAENNLSLYKPITPSNTHWLDWPEGGKL
jgi:hypothetical protein